MPIAQKRLVRVTLDIECYDDLDLDNINWSDLLDLEGDENVYVSIKEKGDVYWCDTSLTVTHVILLYYGITLSLYLFYGRTSGDVLSSTGIPLPSSDCSYKIPD
jgi:hypothetical protein